MAFDTQSGLLKCSSCGRTDKIENIPGKSDSASDGDFTYDMDEDDKKAAE
jgi:hypothetical protein